MDRRRLRDLPSWVEMESEKRFKYSNILLCASPMLMYAAGPPPPPPPAIVFSSALLQHGGVNWGYGPSQWRCIFLYCPSKDWKGVENSRGVYHGFSIHWMLVLALLIRLGKKGTTLEIVVKITIICILFIPK